MYTSVAKRILIIKCTKFGPLILRKIIKILAKMHQIRFRLGLCPQPRWGAYNAPPDPLAGFKGPTSKEGEGKGERGGENGRGRGGKERGKREGKGIEKEGRGGMRKKGRVWGGRVREENEGREGAPFLKS